MPRIAYERHNFKQTTLDIIDTANAVCARYAAQGFDLTLRQLYYVFISEDLFPNSWIDRAYNRRNGLGEETKNTQKNYNRLGNAIDKARKAGLLDWDYITDRTRNLRGLKHYKGASEYVKEGSTLLQIDKWEDQPNRPEVWVEKDALVGVLQSVCPNEDVDFFSCRGFTSSSEMWGAAQRIRRIINSGQRFVLIHMGDHDPSGIDMTRDIQERIAMFLTKDLQVHDGNSYSDAHDIVSGAFEYRRIALNMPQIERFRPPPNPAKTTDSRYESYRELYGDDSWELDALPPDRLVGLVRAHIKDVRDAALWKAQVEREDGFRKELATLARHWPDAVKFAFSKDEKARKVRKPK